MKLLAVFSVLIFLINETTGSYWDEFVDDMVSTTVNDPEHLKKKEVVNNHAIPKHHVTRKEYRKERERKRKLEMKKQMERERDKRRELLREEEREKTMQREMPWKMPRDTKLKKINLKRRLPPYGPPNNLLPQHRADNNTPDTAKEKISERKKEDERNKNNPKRHLRPYPKPNDFPSQRSVDNITPHTGEKENERK